MGIAEKRDTPDRIQVGMDEITFVVPSAQTGGSLSAAEVRLPPGGGPPMMHVHAPHEIYRVEEGELAIYLADPDGEVERIAAGPGAVVLLPGGRPHTVRNESPNPARAYVVFTPGEAIESFFRAAGALAADGHPAIEDVLALAAQHEIEMTGPIPAPA